MEAGYKVCAGSDDETCIDTAHRLWANESLPGELAQVLPSPRHFEQAASLVSRDAIAYGNDVQRHLDAFRPYHEAGFDTIYINQIGATESGTSAADFFQLYRDKVLPELRRLG